MECLCGWVAALLCLGNLGVRDCDERGLRGVENGEYDSRGASGFCVMNRYADQGAMMRFSVLSGPGLLIAGLFASACVQTSSLETPGGLMDDPRAVMVTVDAEEPWAMEAVNYTGGVVTPIVQGDGDCDESPILVLGPDFQMNLNTGRPVRWSETYAPYLVFFGGNTGFAIRAPRADVVSANLWDGGIELVLVEPEECTSENMDLLADDSPSTICEPLGEIRIHVSPLSPGGTPEQCSEAFALEGRPTCDLRYSSHVVCPSAL